MIERLAGSGSERPQVDTWGSRSAGVGCIAALVHNEVN